MTLKKKVLQLRADTLLVCFFHYQYHKLTYPESLHYFMVKVPATVQINETRAMLKNWSTSTGNAAMPHVRHEQPAFEHEY